MFEISQGRLNQKLDFKRKDEIGNMAQTFNFMAQGLQEKSYIEDFWKNLNWDAANNLFEKWSK